MTEEDLKQIRREIIKAEIASLKARLVAVGGFVLNNNLQIECTVLRKQIEILEGELK